MDQIALRLQFFTKTAFTEGFCLTRKTGGVLFWDSGRSGCLFPLQYPCLYKEKEEKLLASYAKSSPDPKSMQLLPKNALDGNKDTSFSIEAGNKDASWKSCYKDEG